jgi:hypothetical protein
VEPSVSSWRGGNPLARTQINVYNSVRTGACCPKGLVQSTLIFSKSNWMTREFWMIETLSLKCEKGKKFAFCYISQFEGRGGWDSMDFSFNNHRRYIQESIKWKLRTRLSCGRTTRLLFCPLPAVAQPMTHRKTEKERQLAGGKERGWHWAGSYKRKKVWSSINKSILSGMIPLWFFRNNWRKISIKLTLASPANCEI